MCVQARNSLQAGTYSSKLSASVASATAKSNGFKEHILEHTKHQRPNKTIQSSQPFFEKEFLNQNNHRGRTKSALLLLIALALAGTCFYAKLVCVCVYKPIERERETGMMMTTTGVIEHALALSVYLSVRGTGSL